MHEPGQARGHAFAQGNPADRTARTDHSLRSAQIRSEAYDWVTSESPTEHTVVLSCLITNSADGCSYVDKERLAPAPRMVVQNGSSEREAVGYLSSDIVLRHKTGTLHRSTSFQL